MKHKHKDELATYMISIRPMDHDHYIASVRCLLNQTNLANKIYISNSKTNQYIYMLITLGTDQANVYVYMCFPHHR